ncbi:ABC transporter substrate-binding protein [Pseudoduganella sp. UC29_106]|uniref:ABC transporter substrate-binding protein n=1 Tax=Pseudoduganella sp. UC29_106 TaxID=3374553 RepID=UPI003757BBEE
MTRISSAWLAVALAIGAGAAGAAGVMAPAAAALPEIRFADAIDTPTSMPGHRSRNTATDGILLHVVESLVALRSDFSVGPMLADSWTISPDGRTYDFKLRKGVRFHNGAPVTSAEVVWSLQRILNPKSESYCRNQYDGSKGARVVSASAPAPDEVRIVLEQPYALLLQQMANIQCPLAVLHPSSVDANGKWIKPVGTGPYMWGEWRKGQYVQLNAFTGYMPREEKPDGLAGAKRALANLRFVVIPDAASQKVAFMSGQVDLIVADSQNPPPPSPSWDIVPEQDMDPNALLMQTGDPLLGKPEMRRAIALSLDLPLLVSSLSNGQTRYNPSLVPLVSPYYSPVHAEGYRKDLAQAKQLLAQAGYKGETIRIQTNKRYPDTYRLAVVVQNMLSKSGIRTEIEVLEWATQVSNFRSGKFQMMAFTYSARIDPSTMYGDILGDKSRSATLQWTNPEASGILAGIKGETDPAMRRAAFEELHKRMVADVPLLHVNNTPVLLAVSKRLHGFAPWPLRRPRLFNVSKD